METWKICYYNQMYVLLIELSAEVELLMMLLVCIETY